MVRISKRPKKSFRETTSPKMVRYMSADVPLYHGNMGRKSGCSSLGGSASSLQAFHPHFISGNNLTQSLHEPARQQVCACRLQDVKDAGMPCACRTMGRTVDTHCADSLEQGRLVPRPPGARSLGHADGPRGVRRQQGSREACQQCVGQVCREVPQHPAHSPHRCLVHDLARRTLHELHAHVSTISSACLWLRVL